MQSDLLQQAIVDATALKEAAIKSAENTLIEKYSHEFQQTVEKLLEQEAAAVPTPELPPDAALTGAPTAPPDAAAAPDATSALDMSAAGEEKTDGGKALDNVAVSFLDGDEDEKIIINFDQIKKTMNEMFDLDEEILSERDIASVGETIMQDALAPGAPVEAGQNELEEELELEEGWMEENDADPAAMQPDIEEGLEELALEEDVLELEEEILQEMAPEEAQKQLEIHNAQRASLESVSEDIEITEEELAELAESLKVDLNIESQGRGYMGSTTTTKREQRNVELAAARDDKVTEAREEEAEKMEDLMKENASLKSTNEKIFSTLETLKEQLQKVNLSNAKLLYTNKALGNISLNERQKNQIVESISKADSVLAAKTIYETLQNAVEGTKVEKQAPQSLREALNRAATPFVTKKSPANSINDVMAERLKALAGIKSTK